MARDILETEHDERVRSMQDKQSAGGDYPPYTVELSADLLEYSSSQEIPKFGSHMYYAISTEPIHTWENLDLGVLSKEVIVDSVKASNANVSTMSLKSTKSKSLMEAEKNATKSPKSRRPVGQPFSPLASKEASPSERRPITWGSNLIEVTEPKEKEEKEEDDEKDEYDDGFVCKFFNTNNIQSPKVTFSPTSGSPEKSSTPIKQSTPGIPSPVSARSAQGRSTNDSFQARVDNFLDDLMETSMPADLRDSYGFMSPPSSPTSRTDQSFDDLMNTSMPQYYDDNYDYSPKESPTKSPRTPGQSSPLPQVRHISMSSRDEEAREIIEEGNKLLKEQELQVKENSTPPKAPSPRDHGQEGSPIKTPPRLSPMKTPPRMSPMKTPLRMSPMKSPERSPDSRPLHLSRFSGSPSTRLDTTPTTLRQSPGVGQASTPG